MIYTGQPGTTDARLAAVQPGAIPTVASSDAGAAAEGAGFDLSDTDSATLAEAGGAAPIRRVVASPAAALALPASAGISHALDGSAASLLDTPARIGSPLAVAAAPEASFGLSGSGGATLAFGASPAAGIDIAGAGTTPVADAGMSALGWLDGKRDTVIAATANRRTQLPLSGSLSMAANANISFYRGEDVTLTVTMSPATNITGWTLQFTVRKAYGDAAALITKTTGAGITITDATNGVFTVSIASADTLDLEQRAYVFDIQRTNSGNRTVLTIGNLTLLPEVTL